LVDKTYPNMKKQLLLTLLVFLVAPFSLLAQTTYSCGELFYDTGGPNGNYGDNENNMAVLTSAIPGQTVILTLSDVFIQDGDVLTIYNGPSPNYPVLATITNVTGEQYTFISSDVSGALSYSFTSNASGNNSGWIGAVECMQSNCMPPSQISVQTQNSNSAFISWADPNGSAMQWEIIISTSGSAPLPGDTGIIVTTPSYLAANLIPNTFYTVFIRSYCDPSTVSDWSTGYTFYLPGCDNPSNAAVTNITTNSADIAWIGGAATEWEILVLPVSAGSPAATTSGTPVTTTNYNATGLTPSTVYNVFIRSICNGVPTPWNNLTPFSTLAGTTATCGSVFTDTAGANANYTNGSNVTTVLCPDTTGQAVTVTFTSFAVETNYDALYVYNGNSVNATMLSSNNPAPTSNVGPAGGYWGATNPGPFTSTSPDGCLTFVFKSDSSVTQAGWVANVTCAAQSNCLAPTAVTASNATSSSVVVSWNNTSSNATQWEVVAVPCGMTAPTPNFATTVATTNPFVLTGLNATTCYTIFVRAVCSPTETSAWASSTTTITTLLAPPVCGGTFTDPAGANANYANSTDSTTTICPTNPVDVVTVTFTTFATEATWDGLYVFNGNSINAPMIPSTNGAGNVPGGVAGAWWGTLTGSNLPSFTSSSPDGCLTFRFRSDASVNGVGWVANVTCGPAPTCLKPTNLITANITTTSMTVGWTAGSPNDTQWEVFVLPCGAPAPTATSTGGILTSVNPTTITGLLPSTCYDIYVRTICSTTDISICTFLPNQSTSIAPPSCGNQFTDAGGASANYPNNANQTYTICPTTPGEIVTVTFTSFSTETNWDALYVYNGNSSSAPMIPSTNGPANVPGGIAGGYWGTAIPGPFTSSSPDGCLTFVFRSDGSVVQSGWTADVTCAPDQPKILVVAFVDLNANGTQDAGEPNFPSGNFVVQQNNSGTDMLVYAPTGMYTIYDTDPNNTYDISYQVLTEAAPYFSGNGFTVNDVNIPTNGGTQVFYFPITNTQPFSDVEVSLTPYGAPPRPGLTYMQRLVIKNYGIAAASGTVTYVRPTQVTGITVTPTGTVATANGFTYAFSNLQPNQTITLLITLTVPAAPTVNLNDLLTATATATSANDINAQNNAATLSQIVVNSWDPNDKMETHGDKIPFSSFNQNDYLFYTIHFQNMGTANAIDVRIEDDLSPLIDHESIRMVSSSHNYIMTREGNHVEWKFENIQLVPEIVNPDASKGYVTFRVKLNPGFQVGTIVPNTASIYFDSNPAIVTNTWTTKFTSPLGVNSQEYIAFVMYPNPADHAVTFEANNSGETLSDITIYDLLGKEVKAVHNLNVTNTTLSIEELPQGLYMVEIATESGLKLTQKLVVK
jgi:hypothetical protein